MELKDLPDLDIFDSLWSWLHWLSFRMGGIFRKGFSVTLEAVLELDLVKHAGLELTKTHLLLPPPVLRLKSCATTSWLSNDIFTELSPLTP